MPKMSDLIKMVSDCEDSHTLDLVFDELARNQNFQPTLEDVNYFWESLSLKIQEAFSADLQADISVVDLVDQLVKRIDMSPFDRERVLSEMEDRGIFNAYLKEKVLKNDK